MPGHLCVFGWEECAWLSCHNEAVSMHGCLVLRLCIPLVGSEGKENVNHGGIRRGGEGKLGERDCTCVAQKRRIVWIGTLGSHNFHCR